METDNISLLKKFTEDFCAIVNLHCSYVIVSGYLAISSGRSRGTEDIDILIPQLTVAEFRKLHQDLSAKFTLFAVDDVLEAYDTLVSGANVRYVYKDAIIPNMEVKFAKSYIDKENLVSRKKIPLTNTDVYFAPIECAIAYKEYLGSPKDLSDALHLQRVYAEELRLDVIGYYRELIKEHLG